MPSLDDNNNSMFYMRTTYRARRSNHCAPAARAVPNLFLPPLSASPQCPSPANPSGKSVPNWSWRRHFTGSGFSAQSREGRVDLL